MTLVPRCVDDIQQFHALLLADSIAVRALGDKFHTRWEPEKPGLLTTTMAIPRIENSPIELQAYPQIHHVARQLIHALD
jgi:protein lysine acetyltransferase